MRFRIRKGKDCSVYTIIVSGLVDEDAGWDIMQIAQTMLSMTRCRKLIIDLRMALLDEGLSVFTSDTLLAVFEEGLLSKDAALIIRHRYDSEIRLCSDQLPLQPTGGFINVQINEAKFLARAMKWLEQEARMLAH
ncbi:hypothetical protein [Desulfobulbus alkaliphilus]|uniref:hypothetical protein n=1 Tax=Desulfobulbus alkaliphilus TaxID=869814 RepID=UPI001963894D|nr:hypothetical protein [Desulfobulbus alkaliphilus]MBM9535833.1 hypothetical protein [Desulfobulbus alkaliphilus]